MKEIRKISGTKVRRACITRNWFTCGDNNAYDSLFAYIYGVSDEGRNIDTDRLEFIAKKIKQYSNTEYNVAEIMFVLNAECCTIYFE